jgi:hypothetical protein
LPTKSKTHIATNTQIDVELDVELANMLVAKIDDLVNVKKLDAQTALYVIRGYLIGYSDGRRL